MQLSWDLPSCLLFCWATSKSHAEKWKLFKIKVTRLHSSRMRTACALTVSPSILCAGGGLLLEGFVPGLGGVCFLGGVPGLGGGVPGLGGSASWGGAPGLGGSCSRGVSASWGVCSGGYLPGPGGCTFPGTPPPVNRILDTCL